MKRYQTALVCLALLAVGLAVRLPGLDTFLTPDEGDWGRNTAQFVTALMKHDWARTFTVGQPGVTTTWAGSAGLALKWWLDRPGDTRDLAGLAQALAGQPNRLDLVPWLRFPVVLACVLGTLLIYWLARKLLGEGPALLAAGLLAFDPFFLAHSRVLQTDALQATFLAIGWLALLAVARTGQRRYFVLSGLSLAAAVLSKSPALSVGPLVAGWVLWLGWSGAPQQPGRARAAGSLAGLLWVGIPALAGAWLLWPALWVTPVEVAQRLWDLMRTYSQTGHELGNFWLGQPVSSPGALFYPAVLLWRSTPVTLVGLLPAALFGLHLVFAGRRRPGAAIPAAGGRTPLSEPAILAGLWLFLFWFTLMISLGDKKFDRYLLPVFPILDLLAAWGWFQLGKSIAARFQVQRRSGGPGIPNVSTFRIAAGRQGALNPSSRYRSGIAWYVGGSLVLVGVQAALALTARPNYLSVYNPLLGGINTARQVMLVGWGEGLDQAAHYLNAQRADGNVAAWYGQNVFGAFYQGQSYDPYYDVRTPADLYARDTDYVVTYVNQEQRRLLDPEVQAKLETPIFSVYAGPVALAQVYRWPKPFDHTADRLLAPGLRLLGWDLPAQAPVAGTQELVLYWDAAELANRPTGSEPVRAWLKDAAGEVWATAQGTPEADQRPASDWSGRTAAGQGFTLRLPTGLSAGTYRVEMAAPDGQGLALGNVTIEATQLATARPAVDWQPAGGQVLFGNGITLAGHALQRQGQELSLDLLWTARQSPCEADKYFVHVIGDGDQIVAQADEVLDLGTARPGWQPGDLVRRRVRLHLPAGNSEPTLRIFVGLYRPADGARLPLVVNDQAMADGRYLLTTLSAP